jgi:nitrogen fixation NifU-like protein
MDDSLYKEIILDRYKNPQNFGNIKGVKQAEQANYLCGDKLKIYIKTDKDGVIEEAKFMGGGCAISMAAVDLLLDEIVGKKLSQVKKMKGEEIEKMLGMDLTPARKKCAYLGLEVIKKI